MRYLSRSPAEYSRNGSPMAFTFAQIRGNKRLGPRHTLWNRLTLGSLSSPLWTASSIFADFLWAVFTLRLVHPVTATTRKRERERERFVEWRFGKPVILIDFVTQMMEEFISNYWRTNWFPCLEIERSPNVIILISIFYDSIFSPLNLSFVVGAENICSSSPGKAFFCEVLCCTLKISWLISIYRNTCRAFTFYKTSLSTPPKHIVQKSRCSSGQQNTFLKHVQISQSYSPIHFSRNSSLVVLHAGNTFSPNERDHFQLGLRGGIRKDGRRRGVTKRRRKREGENGGARVPQISVDKSET